MNVPCVRVGTHFGLHGHFLPLKYWKEKRAIGDHKLIVSGDSSPQLLSSWEDTQERMERDRERENYFDYITSCDETISAIYTAYYHYYHYWFRSCCCCCSVFFFYCCCLCVIFGRCFTLFTWSLSLYIGGFLTFLASLKNWIYSCCDPCCFGCCRFFWLTTVATNLILCTVDIIRRAISNLATYFNHIFDYWLGLIYAHTPNWYIIAWVDCHQNNVLLSFNLIPFGWNWILVAFIHSFISFSFLSRPRVYQK